MNKINAFLICIGLPCLFFFGGNYMYVNYPEITKIGFFIFLCFTVFVMFWACWELMKLTAVATIETHKWINGSLEDNNKN